MTEKINPEPRRWNAGSLFWGLLVILIGGLMLLDNIGVYDFDIARIWQLWPIIIIGIGISMLSLKGWLAGLLSGLLIVGTLAAIVYVTSFEQNTTSGEAKTVSQVIAAPDLPADTASELIIDTGATSL